MTRIVLLCTALLGLSACGTPGALLVGASMATLIHTDKTVGDHVVSWATDKDCSLLYAADDKDYCQPLESPEKEQVAFMNSTLYCYRTLGGVSCYDRPDYTASSQTRINFGNTLIEPLGSPALAAVPEDGLQ